MAGFANSISNNLDIIFASNVDFSGAPNPGNTITTNGQLLIGSTALNAGGTHINVGTITSPLGTVTIGYSSPNITIDVAGGAAAVEHLTGNTGGQLNPTLNNFNILGTGSTTVAGSGSTLTVQMTGLTNHAVLVGAGTATITKVGPTATSGQVLQSQGSSADPAFSTATYPSTTTSQQILYSSSNNVVGQLTTANSSFPATDSSGNLAMRTLSVKITKFTGHGTYTYTPTSGMIYCVAEVVGAGGGGAGCSTTGASTVSAGGGGGGGGYTRKAVSAATVGASQTITVGQGGAGGTGNAAGSTGGTSSFGAILSATGGSGGNNAGAATATVTDGSNGGNGSGGDVNTYGTSGSSSFGVVISGSPAVYGGEGGSSFFGPGARSLSTTSVGAGANGNTPAGYGGGGSGAFNSTSSASAYNGGAGQDGIVVVTEYIIS